MYKYYYYCYYYTRHTTAFVLFAGLQICDLNLVQEPALQFPVPGVVVPDAQERQRSKALLRAEYEVHDAPRCQLITSVLSMKFMMLPVVSSSPPC